MLKDKRFSIFAVATLMAVSFAAAPVSAAKPPPPYTGIGKPGPNTSGQICFISSWSGNGGWEIGDKFKAGYSDDSSVYSWDETTGNSTQGACGFVILGGILGIPYSVDASGFTFNSGTARQGVKVDELSRPVNEPTEINRCEDAVTEPVEGAGGGKTVIGSGYTVAKQQSSLVFTVHIVLPNPPKCSPRLLHGDFIPESGGGWFTASSLPVPESVFERSDEVMVTVSADPANKPKANCGLSTEDDSCSENGAWQGELTFKRYHG